MGAGARKAEVDGFDKEGALLVALPSSHSLLLGSGVGNKKRLEPQQPRKFPQFDKSYGTEFDH